jgi:hypothetical protein
VPRIRFQHPDVEVSINRRVDPVAQEPEVEVTLADGSSHSIATVGLRDDEILARVCEAAAIEGEAAAAAAAKPPPSA